MPGGYANPFQYHRDIGRSKWESEFGFGEGMFPNPVIDFSAGGSLSRIPIADPDTNAQLLRLVAGKRTDTANPNQPDPFSPYVCGNPDRYGAQPPLVRNRRAPRPGKRCVPKPSRMEREW
jgi:hypothetical protein